MFNDLVNKYQTSLSTSGRFIKKNNVELVGIILVEPSLASFSTLNEKLWALKHNTSSRPVCYCGNQTKYHISSQKYHKFCSTSCSRLNPETLTSRNKKRIESGAVEKIQETINTRYSPAAIKEKRKAGVLAKFGVDNYFATTEFKEQNTQRNLTQYGVTHYSQTNECKGKYKATCLAKYGVDHYSKSTQFKGIVDDRYSKMSSGVREKYGVDHTSQIKIANLMQQLSDHEWLYDQYITQNKSSDSIADEYNVSATTVLNYLRKAEIDIKSFVIGYSYKCIEWLDYISKSTGYCINHALNGGEFKIPSTRYKADGYCANTNTIYEFHGDVWHGNPAIYKDDQCPNPFSTKTAKELFNATVKKENIIKQLNYNLVVMWETDWECLKTTMRTA